MREIRDHCRLAPDGQEYMKTAVARLRLSARSYHRILKVSRTIADLDNQADILIKHLAEALQYRPKVE
jgi:magnesium chelatase family protein